MNITTFLKSRGFDSFEGCCQSVPDQVKDLINLTNKPNIKVMEIGFNAGHSAEVFLHYNNTLTLTSFDLGEHSYIKSAKEYIDFIYPNRHTLILGDSRETLPKYIENNKNIKFDFIFIDGGRDYEIANQDMENCLHLAHKDTIIALDDTIFTKNWEAYYTIGPTRTWTEHLEQKKIIELNKKDYCNGRGMAWGKYVLPLKKIFIVFESRYNGLSDLLKDNNNGSIIMGEIKWFYSLIKNLLENKNEVIHCNDIMNFIITYRQLKDNNNLILIMDWLTIPPTINYLLDNIDNIYCMCYWGRDENSIKELGNNNITISLKNVLTPFNYNNNNSYLGYNLKYLCNKYNTNKYKNIGILWGKDINYININLVEYLTKRGLEFYSVTNQNINIEGVYNLGVLSKDSWCHLLNDGKYVLSFGAPKSGPTILEALYYNKVLFGPVEQYPLSIHNQNILLNLY